MFVPNEQPSSNPFLNYGKDRASPKLHEIGPSQRGGKLLILDLMRLNCFWLLAHEHFS